MATESPIRMTEARGKWSSHPGTASFSSSPVNMPMDAEGLLVKGQYQSGKPMAPARSGSAPPSMEGSLAAFENLVQNSVLGSGSPSRMLKDSSSSPNYSCNYHVLGRVGSSSSSYVSISRGALPTHKEESDDDRSPQHASDDRMDKSSAVWSGQELSSSIGRHRSLVDLKQVNASRTSSPVSDQLHAFSHGSAGEVVDSSVGDYSLPDQPSRVPNLVASTLCADDVDSTRQIDLSSASALRSASLVSLENTIPPGKKNAQSHTNSNQESDVITCGAFGIKNLQSGLKNLDISSPENLDVHPTHEERPVFYQNNFVKPQISQQNNSLQFQGFVPQVLSQGVNDAYMDINQIPYVGKLPTSEVQPVLQSSGFTPPIYAPTAAYIPSASAYYSGMPHPGVMYPSQYGLGGYAVNPAYYSQYVTGYSQNALPFTFDAPPSPQYNARTSGVPSPSGSSNSVDMQSLNKYYGHYGILQSSFSDPNMQYRPPYGDFYNVPGQLEPLGIRDSVIGGQGNSSISQKRSDLTGLSSDIRSQNQGAGGMNQRRGGFTAPNYYGNSTNVGVFLPIPSATLPSPVLPASPMGGSNQSYGRGEPRFRTDSSRNTSLHAGWSDQRVFESVNYSKTYSFLEELKSGKGRRLELSDIVGHVVEFSVDQHGSRFIQQKLENCNLEEKSSVFKEVLPHASKLMTDVFGNYVIQKFFEYGTLEQRRELANQLRGQILPLSLQMYGCRVIQKALDIIELEQKAELVHELDGHVMKCVRDQNGNHVIQKCIESIPAEKIDFIISAFHGQVATLSMHPYGCRVIQRVLEHCSDGWQCQFIVDEILESVCDLAQNQYGNYVTQHVLERGQPQERSQIIKKLSAKVVPLSQHKFASNVIEKCLEYGDAESRGLLIEEVIGQNDGNDNLLVMMKDQYANYVVQKILDMCTESQQDLLLGRIKVHLNALKKYTYGKHIVARVESLCGEEA